MVINNCLALIADLLVCKTKPGMPCELPFAYNGNYYDTCINVDNDGVPWCYTNATLKYWGICDTSTCPKSNGVYYFFFQPSL